MYPEQTFVGVQERFSQMLKPRIRAFLEYIYLFIAITLFCILVVMHANYVQQPGCSSELTGVETMEAQLIRIKITSAGLWSQNEYENNVMNAPVMETAAINVKVADVNEDGLNFLDAKFWFNWISSAPRRGKSALRFWKSDMDFESQPDTYTSSEGFMPAVDDAVLKINKDESRSRFPESVKESFRAAIIHLSRRWHGRLSFFWRHARRIIGSLWVPALQRFMLNRRSNFQQHPDFHITSSTILASTLHITRVNNRNSGPANANLSSGPGPGPGVRGGPDLVMPTNGTSVLSELHQRPENQNSDGLGHPPEI